MKLSEKRFRKIVNESIRKVLKEGESYGWVVEPSEAQEAYEFACERMGEDYVNEQIVRAMGSDALADYLAFVFRMNDFEEWNERGEQA